MLNIGKYFKFNPSAENIFAKISQEMLRQNLTVSILFENEKKVSNYRGENTEYITNETFLNIIHKLGLQDLNTAERDSILKILRKPDFINKIRLIDLKEILANFGVNEYENNTNEEDELTETDDPRRK